MKQTPLYKKISDHYYKLILDGKLKYNDQLPTEKEIMINFSVSRITAKNAINLLAEQGVVKRIPGKGTFVITHYNLEEKNDERLNKTIGLILSDIDETFGTQILRSIESEVSGKGYQLVFKLTKENKEQEIQTIQNMISLGVKGIINQPAHGFIYSDEILKFYLSGFPLVFIDRYMEKTKIPFVSTDNESNNILNIFFITTSSN